MSQNKSKSSVRAGPRSRTRPDTQDASQIDMSSLGDQIDDMPSRADGDPPVGGSSQRNNTASTSRSNGASSGGVQQIPTADSDDEGGSVAAAALKRLERARRVRNNLDLPPSDSQRSVRSADTNDWNDNYIRARERIQKFRKIRMNLDEQAERATDDDQTQRLFSDTLRNVIDAEAPECRTAEEFMEIQRMLEVSGKVIQGALQSVMSNYGSIKPIDVARAAAEDPRLALITIKLARRKIKERLGTIKMLGGKRAHAGPNSLELAGQTETQAPKKERAARQKKQEKVAVVPEKSTEEDDRNVNDATARGVKAMHEKLRVHKKMPLFELVRDPGNDFQKTALNTHILAILLDRQMARMLAATDPKSCRKKDAIMVYFVAHKAIQTDANARKKLAEDVEKGHTWITRWDNSFLTLVREATDYTQGFDDSYSVLDGQDADGASGGAGPSGYNPPSKQSKR